MEKIKTARNVEVEVYLKDPYPAPWMEFFGVSAREIIEKLEKWPTSEVRLIEKTVSLDEAWEHVFQREFSSISLKTLKQLQRGVKSALVGAEIIETGDLFLVYLEGTPLTGKVTSTLPSGKVSFHPIKTKIRISLRGELPQLP